MRWLTFLILTGILLQTCSKGVILTEYLINRDFIATVLCINKDNPQKHCDGKCHLKKQLAKDDEQQGSRQLVKTGVEMVYLVSGKLNMEWPESVRTPHFYIYTEPVSVNRAGDIFHPPGIFIS